MGHLAPASLYPPVQPSCVSIFVGEMVHVVAVILMQFFCGCNIDVVGCGCKMVVGVQIVVSVVVFVEVMHDIIRTGVHSIHPIVGSLAYMEVGVTRQKGCHESVLRL